MASCWTYDFVYELSTWERGEDDLLEEDEKDAFGLLLLTPDSLEMLQIRIGESRQKGGRKGKEDRKFRESLRKGVTGKHGTQG